MLELKPISQSIYPTHAEVAPPPWQRIFKLALFAWILGMLTLALTASGVLWGCSGGGGGGGGDGTSVNALALPSRIELTKVDDSSDASQHITSHWNFLSKVAADKNIYNAAGTDYNSLKKDSWGESKLDTLNLVNEILAVVKDTGYDKMVNQGAYVALVNSPGDNEDAGQSAGATTVTVTEQLSEMVVKVERASNTAPMYIYFWLKEEMGSEESSKAAMIKGRFEVTHGVDANYPMGAMEAYIIGMPLDADGDEITGAEPMMKIGITIAAEDGQAVVEMAQREQREEDGYPITYRSEMRIQADTDFQNGKAYVHEYEPDWDDRQNWGDEPTYRDDDLQVAFNPSYIKIDDNGDIYVFDKTNLSHNVHRYKVFDTSGAAVKISSGFPIRFKSAADTNTYGKYGYVGYYGVWTQNNSAITGTPTVIREDNSQEYKIKQMPGKLMKHTKTTTTLAKITGLELSKWDQYTSGDIIVVWNGTNFVQIGYRNQSTNWQPVYEQGDTIIFNEWEGAWCNALQAHLPLGQITYPTNTSTVTYHAQKTLIPGGDDFPTTLYYYGPGINENDWEYNWGTPTRKTYTYDSTWVLKEAGTPVIYVPTQDAYMTSKTIQPLTTTDIQESWNQQVYYSWASGTDQWSKLTILLDSNDEPVSFEAPLRLSFTHQNGYDFNYASGDPNAGKMFSMEYDGFELHVPGSYDDEKNRWMPIINLKDSHDSGLQLDGSDGNTYVLKGWAEELMMAEVESGDAGYNSIVASLDTDTPIDEPTIDDTMDAAISQLFSNSSAWQVPTNVDVKIIKGELVGQ